MINERFEAEKSGKEAVINLLKNNPENLAPLFEYLTVRENECRNGIDNLRLTLDLLDIYIGAGEAFHDAAWDTLEDAFVQARAEGEENICQKLLDQRTVLLER